jgi:hypothetical protein
MNKYAKYFLIENKIKNQGCQIDRSELIISFSEGTKSSLKELSEFEYREFLTWLTQSFIPENRDSWIKSPENLMRRKIIGIFKEMEYTLPDGSADMKAINAWCLKYSAKKKLLNDHSKTELAKLVLQAELVKKSFINSVTKTPKTT